MRESTHIIVSRRGLFLTFFYQSRPCKVRSGARIGICTAFTFLITRLTILHGTIKTLTLQVLHWLSSRCAYRLDKILTLVQYSSTENEKLRCK